MQKRYRGGLVALEGHLSQECPWRRVLLHSRAAKMSGPMVYAKKLNTLKVLKTHLPQHTLLAHLHVTSCYPQDIDDQNWEGN